MNEQEADVPFQLRKSWSYTGKSVIFPRVGNRITCPPPPVSSSCALGLTPSGRSTIENREAPAPNRAVCSESISGLELLSRDNEAAQSGRSNMAEIPQALVKDLLSTGYFHEQLKNYSESKEIDLASFSRDFAVPYLAGLSETYEKSGKGSKSIILDFAVKHLSNADDAAISESIFGLKRVVEHEMEVNEKAYYKNDEVDRLELLACRRKSESAQSLGKLLICIIRIFKLTEVGTKRDKSENGCDSVVDTIQACWKDSALPSP